MRKFMTNKEISDYLSNLARSKGYELSEYALEDLESTLRCRPWFLDFVLEDGKMVATVLTIEETRELFPEDEEEE